MSIDSIQAVQGRIAEIQGRIGSLAGGAASPGNAAFAGALREAMGANFTGAGAVEPAGGSRPPGGLEGFANGRIPESALTPIAPGQRLWGPAADAYRQMAAAAQAAGINLRVTDSYRPYDDQVAVARSKGLYSQGGLAAEPGTSTHGWGLSVDLDTDGGTLAWLRTNAGRFGFVEDVAREPWHWTFKAPAVRPSALAFDPDRLRLLGS
jgi:hypothetical protein